MGEIPNNVIRVVLVLAIHVWMYDLSGFGHECLTWPGNERNRDAMDDLDVGMEFGI